MQRFCKEVITWKSLRHPNVLSLLGVIMTENQFAMVSEWMSNGNINQFVRENIDVNRYGLVSSPSRFLASSFVDTSVVGRCREGLDSYARSGDDPWRSQRGMHSRAHFLYLPLISFIYQGQYPYRLDRSCLPGGLWSAQNRIGRHKHYILELIDTRWHVLMDEPRAV